MVHKQMSVFDFFEEIEFMGPQSKINLAIKGMCKVVSRTSPKPRQKDLLAHHSIYVFIFTFGATIKKVDGGTWAYKTHRKPRDKNFF